MSARHLIVLAAVCAALAACQTVPTGDSSPGGRPSSAAFKAEDFDWSARAGRGSVDGRVAYSRDGQAYTCTGSVALTPYTPFTRARFRTLYGSIDRAAVPEAVVRARTVENPGADYRSFVRSTTCENGRFEFSGLPDGDWFIITPVSAGGDRIVLMRRISTRGARVSVTL